MSDAGSMASRPKLSTGFSFEWEDQARVCVPPLQKVVWVLVYRCAATHTHPLTQEAFGYVPRLTAHTENEKHERKIDDRKLRACNRCKLLKTLDQFTVWTRF